MKRFTRLMGLGMVFVLMLALIGSVAHAQEPVTIVIGWDQEPGQLYPMVNMVQSGNMEEFYARDVWDWDQDNNIYPVMVEEIPTIENGDVTTNDAGNTVVTYKLRHDMVWSDGEPITSADCAFWHEISMDPGKSANYTRGNYPSVVESMEVVDDYTFTLTYNQPWPDYLNDSYARCSYPAHILQPILERDGNIDGAPQWHGEGVVGYGPYVLTEWVVGDHVTFDRNPNWDGQSPAIDRVILKFIPDSAQMQSALENGEIDLAFLWDDSLVSSYSALPGVTVWSDPWVINDAVWINVSGKGHPALSDINVRQALFYALDRRAMADGLVGPDTVVPDVWWNAKWVPDDLEVREYNVDMANQLLDEAGWTDSDGDGIRDKDGVALNLRFFTTQRQIRMDYQTLIQEYLQAVGIGTQLLPVPAGILFDTWANRGILSNFDYDLAIFGFTNSPLSPNTSGLFACDQIPGPERPDGINNTGYCDPEFDRVDAESNRTVDPDARLALVHENIHRIYDAAIYIGLYTRGTNYALNSDRFNVDSFRDMGRLSINYFRHAEYWQPAGS